jgi:hypothetical protein
VRRAMGASAASGRCCLRVPLRHRRRWRCLVLAVVAALLTAILYDQFVLARRSGSRLLPLFLLGLSCPAPVAVRANMSLLDTRHAELAAIAEQNSLLEQRLRARDGGAAILFLHFHKAGGTSFCAAAGANGERTAINQGGQSVVIDDPGLNCNVCYRISPRGRQRRCPLAATTAPTRTIVSLAPTASSALGSSGSWPTLEVLVYR